MYQRAATARATPPHSRLSSWTRIQDLVLYSTLRLLAFLMVTTEGIYIEKLELQAKFAAHGNFRGKELDPLYSRWQWGKEHVEEAEISGAMGGTGSGGARVINNVRAIRRIGPEEISLP